MREWVKKRFEIWRISVARKILIGRNVQRSAYVSRKDNNDMWAMAERLEAIEKRMMDNYE